MVWGAWFLHFGRFVQFFGADGRVVRSCASGSCEWTYARKKIICLEDISSILDTLLVSFRHFDATRNPVSGLQLSSTWKQARSKGSRELKEVVFDFRGGHTTPLGHRRLTR